VSMRAVRKSGAARLSTALAGGLPCGLVGG
jgi:hypothetical protein